MTRKATLAGLAALAAWATFTLLTALTDPLPPFQLAALTFGISGLGGLVFLIIGGRLSTLKQPWLVWALGIGGIFGYHACYFAALRMADPAPVSLINYVWPLLIVVFASALPGEPKRWQTFVGASCGFVGIWVLFWARGQGSETSQSIYSSTSLPGYCLALAAGVIWASFSVLSRLIKHVPSESVVGFCLATSALATICHFLLAYWGIETTQWPSAPRVWLAVAAIGIGPTGIAFLAWDYAMKHGSIRFLGAASYATPLVSTLLLIAFGYAQASLMLGVTTALIVGGAVMARPR